MPSNNVEVAPGATPLDPATDRVFLTGATGLVGSMVAHCFALEGYHVRCLCRDPDAARSFPELTGNYDKGKIEIIKGDVTDAASVASGMDGCSVVVHCAGVPEGYSKTGDKWDVNVTGTRIVTAAAVERKGQIKRFVHTSTMDTIKQVTGQPYDESHGRAEGPMPTKYQQSKLDSELLVQAAIDNEGLPANFVHPSAVYGPGVERAKTLNAFLLDVATGKAPMVVPGGYPPVHSEDVAWVHVRAAQRGEVGAHYLATDRYMELKELADIVIKTRQQMVEEGAAGEAAKAAKKLKSPMRLSKWLGCTLANVGTFFAGVTGTEPLLPKSVFLGMTEQGHPMHGAESRVARELGVEMRSFENGGCRDVLNRFVREGRL